MNSIGYFEIQATDPMVLRDFYAAAFGWRFTLRPKLPITYYEIDTGGVAGGLLQRPAQVPHTQMGTNAYVCSVQVEDFDATAGRILAMGGIEAMPKFAVPGRCWQGYFVDPDNNTFGVFQADPDAR